MLHVNGLLVEMSMPGKHVFTTMTSAGLFHSDLVEISFCPSAHVVATLERRFVYPTSNEMAR